MTLLLKIKTLLLYQRFIESGIADELDRRMSFGRRERGPYPFER